MWKICGTLVGFMPKPQIKTPVKAKNQNILGLRPKSKPEQNIQQKP